MASASRLKLLFVGTSTAARGTEQHLLGLSRAMQDRGHHVVALLHPAGYLARAGASAGLSTTSAMFRNAMDVRGWWALARQLWRFKPDWVIGAFGHEYFPICVLGAAFGVRVALFRHLNSRLGFVTRRVLSKLFDKMIAVSKDMLGDLTLQGIPARRLSLLYNPIDVRRFAPSEERRAALRSRLGIADDELLVGFAGAMSESKGGAFLVSALNLAMTRSPRLRACWVGNERDHAAIRVEVSPQFAARHHFEPWRDDLESVYPGFDVLAVPSQWREPFGRVSVEAQACGVMVLASAVGGLPETLIAGSGGALLPRDDLHAWSNALVACVERSHDERSAQSLMAVDAAARFASEKVAAEFERLLVA